MATSNGDQFTSEKSVTSSNREKEESKLKDDVIKTKDDVIASLEKRVKVLENEVGVLWERLGRMGEEKREQEMRMALVQEEAARSLRSMVAAQRERKREERRHREMREQLEMQVAMQAEDLRHLRQQLWEETQAHREDVEAIQKRTQEELRKMRVQVNRAKGLGMMSASHPSIPLHFNTLQPPAATRSPRRQRSHQPLLHTVSDVPPSYQQSTGQATPTHATPPNQASYQRAPTTFHTGVTAFHGHLCYFSSFMTTQIHVYDTALGAWHQLPRCPVTNFGLEVVNRSITTIGGRLLTEPGLCTTQLFSLSQGGRDGDRGTWVTSLPSMRLARAQPATTSNSRLVIVAGGEVGDHKTFIADIEVLLLETGVWSHLASSPLGNYSWLTAVLCGDQLYLLEGNGTREKDKMHALHMGALVEALRDPVAQQQWGKRGGLPWRHVRAAPTSNTTCVCAKGQLVAVGGIDQSGKTTNQIWAFDKASDRWKTIGSLKSHRYRSLVSVTATGSLLVIGGLTKTTFTDHMEIFDCF